VRVGKLVSWLFLMVCWLGQDSGNTACAYFSRTFLVLHHAVRESANFPNLTLFTVQEIINICYL
jgi:hypothetical protein